MKIPHNIVRLSKCCERGRNCCAKISHMTKPIIYSGERLTQHALGEQKKACDRFIFDNDNNRIMLVELKSRTLDYSDIREKFDNGVKALDMLLNKQSTNYEIIPILLVKAFNKKPSNNPRTRRLSIKINGKPKSVVYGKYNAQLTDIVRNA